MTTHEKSYANAADLFAVVGEYDEWRGFFFTPLLTKKKMDQLSSFAHVSTDCSLDVLIDVFSLNFLSLKMTLHS